MIGKLTFDKSSMNMSCFLKSLLILKGNGGCVSRQTFTEEMADFMDDVRMGRREFHEIKDIKEGE